MEFINQGNLKKLNSNYNKSRKKTDCHHFQKIRKTQFQIVHLFKSTMMQNQKVIYKNLKLY